MVRADCFGSTDRRISTGNCRETFPVWEEVGQRNQEKREKDKGCADAVPRTEYPSILGKGRAVCRETGKHGSREGGTGDPAMEDRPLLYLKSTFPFRSLSCLGVFPPQSRVDPLGIACSTHPAETGISASHRSLKLARMLDEPTASFPGILTIRHISVHPVGRWCH